MPRGGLSGVVVAMVLAAPLAAQQPPPLWGGLKAGRHVVGYRRASLAAGTLHVWFPASGERGEQLPVGAYFDREAGEALPARLRQAPSAAFPEAVASDGPFPLILYVSEPGAAGPDNTILAEYLASHGYVVAAVSGAESGLDGALDAVAGLSYVSRDAIAVVARGGGWLPAVEFAAGQPAVRAILGLDPPPGGPAAVAPGRSLAILRLRADTPAPGPHDAAKPPGAAGVTVTVPRSTAHSFGDRAAWLDLLDQPDTSAPDHRRLIGAVAHAFLDGALRAWGPSLADLATRLSRAGLEVEGTPVTR
jgi:hypothetical protein